MLNFEMSDKLKFQPKARIIRTIGDQLISGPEAAVIELVKNSFDADASFVRIKFYPPLVAGEGRIEVSDNGHGMTLDDIRLKWMEPATSSKTKQRKSRSGKRSMMGSKGIGRFASAKLGAKMSLLSTAKIQNEKKSILIPELDWSIFNEDVYLADIEIEYEEQITDSENGTTIEIRELKENWDSDRVSKLYKELRRLISPLATRKDYENEFKIFLDLSECTKDTTGFDGKEIVDTANGAHNSYLVEPIPLLSACDYELKGSFDEKGEFKGTFQVKRAGRAAEKVSLSSPTDENEKGPGKFGIHFFIFDREADSIKRNMSNAGMGELSAKEARRILDEITGIAIFRDDFRIRPYGDPETDWLALDSRRVQNPSVRIGHNQIVGIISIGDPESTNLLERSSREGLEENFAFTRLTSLVLKTLNQIVEPKRNSFRVKAGISRKRDPSFDEVRKLSELKKLRNFISSLEPDERERAEKLLNQESAKIQDRIDLLEDRQRVLEAKSSLGAIVGEILHEGSPAARYIAETSPRLLEKLRDLLRIEAANHEKVKQDYINKLHYMRDNGKKLNSLFRNLKPLSGGKRGKPEYFFPVSQVSGAFELFQTHYVDLQIQNNAKGVEAIGYAEDLGTALINLIGNAVHWLEESKTPEPFVLVKIEHKDNQFSIIVTDNGPGISGEFVDQIFDVGFSLKNDGTGLGLNIAREALARSDAKLFYHHSQSGGSTFEILFPAKKRIK